MNKNRISYIMFKLGLEKTDVLSPEQLRILVAIIALCQETGSTTFRDVAMKVYKNENTTHVYYVAKKLRGMGLVDFESNRLARTLRPTCRLEITCND